MGLPHGILVMVTRIRAPSRANDGSMCSQGSLVPLLLDQKQGCLRQLRELRPLDRRMNELLRLEKRQSKELDEFKGLLADAQAGSACRALPKHASWHSPARS